MKQRLRPGKVRFAFGPSRLTECNGSPLVLDPSLDPGFIQCRVLDGSLGNSKVPFRGKEMLLRHLDLHRPTIVHDGIRRGLLQDRP